MPTDAAGSTTPAPPAPRGPASTDLDAAADLQDVEVRVAGRRILGPLSLRVRFGERWVLLGPNGSGKTTLLGLIGGWRHPSSGRTKVLGVTFGQGDIRSLRTRIGHVSHTLAERFPPTSPVEEIVATGRGSTIATWPRAISAHERDRVSTLLEQVGCGLLRGQAFGACSQGERQRVLLARALFHPTALLLLDEPSAGLDLPGRERLIAAVDGIAGGADGPALIMATHHLDEVPASATHAALLRTGGLLDSGPIEQVLTSDALGRCFDLALAVERRGGRWTAWATGRSAPPLARP
jgi:iron complex transport system ATP-binding protein